MKRLVLERLALSVFAVLTFSSVLSASVIGTLDLANCSGGGVAVSATTIDWLPTGGGNGCIITGSTTNVNSSVGHLGTSVTGTILDLNVVSTPLPVANFITFSSLPGLTFTLDLLGPGPASTSCAALPLFAACTPFAGSPFALVNNGTGTAVVLTASGIASDGSLPPSTWAGAFTTQIPGQTAAQIQSTILAGGTITNTHSGSFTLTFVPERNHDGDHGLRIACARSSSPASRLTKLPWTEGAFCVFLPGDLCFQRLCVGLPTR